MSVETRLARIETALVDIAARLGVALPDLAVEVTPVVPVVVAPAVEQADPVV